MLQRALRPALLLGLLASASGGICISKQDLYIEGHGTVTLTELPSNTPVGSAKTCEMEKCTSSYKDDALRIRVDAVPAEGWRLKSISRTFGDPLPLDNPEFTVDDDKDEYNWSITVVFVEQALPDCTPTAQPGSAPTATIRTPKVCIGKYANVEGTALGGQGACVAFADKLATEKFGTDTSLSAVVPAATPLGAQAMTIWTLDGSASVDVYVVDAPVPAVPSPPASAPVGIPFALNGTGLSAVTGIRWELLSGAGGSGDATFSVVSDTELSVTIPSGTGTGSGLLRVGGDCGQASVMLQFTSAD